GTRLRGCDGQDWAGTPSPPVRPISVDSVKERPAARARSSSRAVFCATTGTPAHMTIRPHGHAATRPHGHTTTRPHGHTAARPHHHTTAQRHDRTTARPHDRTTAWTAWQAKIAEEARRSGRRAREGGCPATLVLVRLATNLVPQKRPAV